MRCSELEVLLVAAVTLAGSSSTLSAQSIGQDRVPETEFAAQSALEESYVTFGSGFGTLDPLILEANLAPHLVFDFDGLDLWGLGFFRALTVTPKINLRIFRAESSPVRAPSFMPQISLFRWREPPGEAPADFWTLRISHHSNGQEGDFFLPDGTSNRATGSFSTNFVEAGYSQVFQPGDTASVLLSTLSAEVHPGINMNDELEEGFGRFRIHYRVRYLARVGRGEDPWLETTLQATWRTWSYPGVSWAAKERWSARFTLTYTHQKVKDAGLWLDAYVGPDYYNRSFDRYTTAVRVGLMFNFGGVARGHPADDSSGGADP
jgi:hypothetical protein